MSFDIEMEDWRRRWQTQSPHPASEELAVLKKRVARQTLGLRIGLIGPILVTASIGGWTVLHAIRTADLATAILAAEVWLFILVTWVGCLWIARRTWRPLAETTAAFIDISVRRCRSNIAGASFGAVLYACQLALLVAWHVYTSDVGWLAIATSWPTIVLGWLGLPAFLAWRAWFIRREQAKLEHLLELKRTLVDDNA